MRAELAVRAAARPDLVYGVYRVPDRIRPSAGAEKRRVVEWDVVHAAREPLAPADAPADVVFDARTRWVARRVGEPRPLDEDLALAYLAGAGLVPERTLGIARHTTIDPYETDERHELPCADGKPRVRMHGGAQVVLTYRDSPAYAEGRRRWTAYETDVLEADLSHDTMPRRPCPRARRSTGSPTWSRCSTSTSTRRARSSRRATAGRRCDDVRARPRRVARRVVLGATARAAGAARPRRAGHRPPGRGPRRRARRLRGPGGRLPRAGRGRRGRRRPLAQRADPAARRRAPAGRARSSTCARSCRSRARAWTTSSAARRSRSCSSPARPERDGQGRSHWPDEAAARRALYPDFSDEDARLGVRAAAAAGAHGAAASVPGRPAARARVSIVGAHDAGVNPEWSRRVGARAARRRPVELDAGHFPMITEPEALADAVSSRL